MRHAQRIACLVALVTAGSVTAEGKIEGRWTVASVEAAGPGLKDVELALADGKKVFTLPNEQVPSAKVTIGGTPEKQETYSRGYDALWEKIEGNSPDLFVAWKDCGLLDEKGKARPAYGVRNDSFSLPFEE
jgi:hypothetical protein